MNKNIVALFVLLALALTFYCGYNYFYPSGTWRYKITVNIETPEGVKSGYAIREVHVDPKPPYASPEVTSSVKLKGEAVVIDLGDRGTVFALVSPDDYMSVFEAFPLPGKKPGNGGTTPEGIQYYSSLATEAKELPILHHPKLVAFKDILDPSTITLVYEVRAKQIKNPNDNGYIYKVSKIDDRLAENFGKGVRLKNITVQVVKVSTNLGNLDKYLSPVFWSKFDEWWGSLNPEEKSQKAMLFNFKSEK